MGKIQSIFVLVTWAISRRHIACYLKAIAASIASALIK